MALANSSISSVIEELRALLGERLSTSQAVREHHGKDVSFHAPELPDAVAFAETTEEVSAIVKICAAHDCPVIPFGTGTSLEGQVQASHGGVSIDVSGMKAVLEVSPEDLNCKVQAGVTRKQLNHELRHSGLFFPIDPGANASLGGMAATRASGTNAVRYGTMKDNILSLQAVMPDGQIIWLEMQLTNVQLDNQLQRFKEQQTGNPVSLTIEAGAPQTVIDFVIAAIIGNRQISLSVGLY